MQNQNTVGEIKATFKLALPVALTMAGNMLMGIVDTVVVGRFSSRELAGVAAGNAIFMPFTITGVGLILSLETIVAQAFGAGDYKKCDQALGAGLVIGLAFSAIVTPAVFFLGVNYHWFGSSPEVSGPASNYLVVLSASFPLIMVFNVLQRYWQSFGIATPITLVMIIANVVNLVGDLVLVNGWGFFPALGAKGVAWSTLGARIYALAAISWVSVRLWRARARALPEESRFVWRELWHYPRRLLTRIIELGVPSSLQVGLEVGAFSLATLLAARLGVIELAGHHIVLTLAGFTFMFPLGLSSAAAVRVGSHIGRGDVVAARRAGWIAKLLGAAVMGCFGLILYFVPGPFIRLFTEDASVLRAVLPIIPLVAFFQVFDGVQIVASGTLRGLGNTKFSLYSNLVGHYLIGLPTGLWLCFHYGLGVKGLWGGLTAGLLSTAVLNTVFWHHHSKSYKTF